jgi:hypothetical protein
LHTKILKIYFEINRLLLFCLGDFSLKRGEAKMEKMGSSLLLTLMNSGQESRADLTPRPYDQLQAFHRRWLDESLENGGGRRDRKWTRSSSFTKVLEIARYSCYFAQSDQLKLREFFGANSTKLFLTES